MQERLKEISEATGHSPYLPLQIMAGSLIFWAICFFTSESVFCIPKIWAGNVKSNDDAMKIKHRMAVCVHGVSNTLLGALWWAT